MRATLTLLGASLIANTALLGLLFVRPALVPGPIRNFLASDASRTAAKAAAARDESRRAAAQAKAQAEREAATHRRLWSRLDSPDLSTLIARLRAAGFTAPIIRSIVNARLEARFHARVAALTHESLTVPFWKSEPLGTPNITRVLESMTDISRERVQLRRQLFGDEFFTRDHTAAAESRRAIYGDLPSDKVNLIEQISRDYAEMEQQIRTASQGILLPEDREKLAFLQSERRRDLAAVLSPAELEEHLMRTSPITSRLRPALTVMDATEAEFRALYQIHLPYADVLFPGFGGGSVTTMEMLLKRRELHETLLAQASAALGESRAKEFFRAGITEYQQLTRLAQRDNLPSGTAAHVFDMRDQAASESKRIYENRALSTEEKRAALQALAQTTSNQLLVALGGNAGQQYLRSASWLQVIANGAMITFSPEGGWVTRSVSLRPAAKTKGGP